jgi:hypothetical protein
MSDQLVNFNARIKRIESPKNRYWKDPETGINIPRRLSKAAVLGKKANARGSVLRLLMSVVLGLICLMAARYIRFNLAQVQDAGTQAMTLTVMDFGIAVGLAFVVGTLVRLTSMAHLLAQMTGIAIMLVAMHNLVWMYPSEFAQVYSQAYVDQVRSITVPTSLYLNGEVVRLAGLTAV